MRASDPASPSTMASLATMARVRSPAQYSFEAWRCLPVDRLRQTRPRCDVLLADRPDVTGCIAFLKARPFASATVVPAVNAWEGSARRLR